MSRYGSVRNEFEHDRRQRRQKHRCRRCRLALRPRLDHAAIALARAAIVPASVLMISRQLPACRQRHAIIVARHRREVGDDRHRLLARRVAQPGKDRILAGRRRSASRKAFRLAVAGMQRRQLAVERS